MVRYISIVALLALLAQEWAAKANSNELTSQVRFIPVELWTGADWPGKHAITKNAADLTFGQKREKRISGPVAWTDPINGAVHQVYERTNKSKVQLFTVRADEEGLGRVFDSRGSRVCAPGFKFPLGMWKQGESRTKQFTCWNKSGKAYTRTMTITIEEINYTFDTVPHSLRYRWVADGGGKKGLDNIYVYSPGRGNVDLEYR